MGLEWMAWTEPTAIFFASIALLLVAMTIWQLLAPSVARRGFLPITTTRGDRLFIGLVSAAYLNLAWLGLVSTNLWWALGISVIVMIVIMRWG